MFSEVLTVNEILLVGEYYVLTGRIGARDVLHFQLWRKGARAGRIRYSYYC